MEEFTQLSTELTILKEYIDQRINHAKKEVTNPTYSRMVSPPYERELLAIYRIKKLIDLIYNDGHT